MALGSVCVNQGFLSLEGTTTLSNPVTLVQSGSGSILQISNYTGALTKNITLLNNGQLYDLSNSIGADGTTAGAINIDVGGTMLSGATLDLNGGGILTGSGLGTVTLSNNSNFSGLTVGSGILGTGSISDSGNLKIVTIGDTLQIGNLTSAGTFTIGTSSIRTISALADSPAPNTSQTSGTTTEPIPEPSVMVLLSIAFLVFIRFGLGPKNSAARP